MKRFQGRRGDSSAIQNIHFPMEARLDVRISKER